MSNAPSPAHRRILLSAERGIRVERARLTAEDFGVHGDWSFTKDVLHGGRQEGCDVLELDNGALRATVWCTRGMGIHELVHGDLRLGWDSPVRECVHPASMNLHERGGLGWLEGFNEWLVRCGLEYAGAPGSDTFVNHRGERATMPLTLHGRIANLPASEVEVEVDPEPPHTLTVRGRVFEVCFFGPRLELVTEISTEPGTDRLRVLDRVTNHGAFDQEFQLIYHVNQGPPLVEDGAAVLAPLARLAPLGEHAAAGLAHHDRIGPPRAGFVEQVYLGRPLADPDGRVEVAWCNAARDAAAALSWPLAQLPYLTIWKNAADLRTGYVVGLEPGTSFPLGRRAEREAGRLAVLAPGETRCFDLRVALRRGGNAVAALNRRIDSIQGDRPVEFVEEPPHA